MNNRKEAIKRYYEKNREILIEKSVKYKKKHREKFNEWHKDWRKENPIKVKYYALKSGSRIRKIPFELSFEEYEAIYEKGGTICPCCDCRYSDKNPKSIDRIHNGIPYSTRNCVAVCRKCNRRKNDSTIEDLKRLVEFYTDCDMLLDL